MSAGIVRLGTENDDTLTGGSGDDTLDGGAGRDVLVGKGGADIFRFSAVDDSTRTDPDGIRDFEHGIDKIDLSALGWDAQDVSMGPGGRLELLYSANSDRTYVRDTQSDFSFSLSGDHRGLMSADDFIVSAPTSLLLHILGQSNGRGMRILGDDRESGVTRLVDGLETASGHPVISTWTGEDGQIVDLAVGASTVTGLSTASDAEKARSWWYTDTDQPGEALLQAVAHLQEKLASLDASHTDAALSIIWSQGENAASLIYQATDKDAAAEAYKTATLKVFDYLKAHLGSDLHFYVMESGRIQEEAAHAAGFSDTKIHGLVDGMSRVHVVQEQIALERDDVKIAVNYDDLPMAYEDGEAGHEADYVHLSNESREIVGDRLADFIAMDLGFGHVLEDPGHLPRAALLDIDLQPDSGHPMTIVGADRPDILVGTQGRDSMDGGAGADTLIGGIGRDTLTGGTGADMFFYQSLHDSDATGYDTVTDFTQGSDIIDLTGFGFTGIRHGIETGSILGYRYGGGDTFIRSADGFLLKLSGEIALTEADFRLALPPAAPVPGIELVGSDRDEKLTGTSDNDTIDGGGGKDVLTGGAGADMFRFSHRADSTVANGYDRITDFEDGIDTIDLRGLGYTGIVTGHAAPGELRLVYSDASDRTYVKDDASDFLFVLEGNHLTLHDTDFLFQA